MLIWQALCEPSPQRFASECRDHATSDSNLRVPRPATFSAGTAITELLLNRVYDRSYRITARDQSVIRVKISEANLPETEYRSLAELSRYLAQEESCEP